MNIFGLSLEEIQAEARPPEEEIDILPGIPAALSPEGVAHVLAVSVQTVERMIGKSLLIKTPDENIPKAGLVGYIRSHALADLPVLEDKIKP